MLLAGLNQVLSAKERETRPVKLALVGVGEMGIDILAQVSLMRGIKVLAAADVTPTRAAEGAYAAGYKSEAVRTVENVEEAEKLVKAKPEVLLVTANIQICTELSDVDVVVEATGRPEVTVTTALLAIRNRKHFVTMSVECDITVGHILYWYAKKKGVVYTLGAGDEPSAIQELYEFADSLGLEVIAAGKGKNNPLDRWATPAALKKEAERRGVNPYRLTEFVDGTKTMVEMAAVANSTGLVPDVRGMHGPKADLKDLLKVFTLRGEGGILNRRGVVDYAIGDVAPAVFLVFTTKHPRLIRALELRTMGKGPNYLLVRPYHLCSMEVPLSAALAALEQRPTMAPYRGRVADVMTVAKMDLSPGTVLDKIGGSHYFGLIERSQLMREEGALPIGLAEGAILTRYLERGAPITFADVEAPEESVLWKVWRIQNRWLKGDLSDPQAFEALEAIRV